MARMGVYDQIKKAFQDVFVPEIHELRGEIRRLDQKVDGILLTLKIGGLTQKLSDLDTRLTDKIESLDARLAALEARRPA